MLKPTIIQGEGSIMVSKQGLSRRVFNAGAAAMAAGAASGLGFNIARAQGAALKVGVVLPRSGPQGKIGQACQQGVDLAVPVLRELGYPAIEQMQVDTETNVQRARAVTEKAIQDGAKLIIGAFDSGATTAIAQVCEQRGVPLVINIAAAPPITEQGYKFVFRNFPTAIRIVQDALALQKEIFAMTGKAPKKGVLLHVNDTFGESVKGGILALFGGANMPYPLPAPIAYDPNARDLSAEVAVAKASGADIVWTVSRLNDSMLLTREMVKQRFEPMAIVSSGPGFYEDQYLKTLGKVADHVISCVPTYDPNKPMTKKLRALAKTMFPDVNIDTNHVYSFEAMLIAADAYKRAGSDNAVALADALRKTDIKDHSSVGDGIRFDAKGQNMTLGLAAVQNRGGKLLVVAPKAAAEDKVIFPVPGWRARG
jgi:branched-chain amino acid transport system substrate-binding protein